jgi:hypothetical protein
MPNSDLPAQQSPLFPPGSDTHPNSFAKFAAQKPVVPPATLPQPVASPPPVSPPNNVTVQVTSPQPAAPQTTATIPVTVTPPVNNTVPVATAPTPPIKIELNISTTPQVVTPTPVKPAEKAQEGVVIDSGAATTQAPAPPQKESLLKKIVHWGAFLSLMSLGVKGFFDSLYFITVEFQHFENGLENHLVETKLVSQLILKAGLLIFGTALCIFFALQLSLLSKRGNKWLTIFTSIAVFFISYFVLQHAGTINVVDVFKEIQQQPVL